MLDRDQAAMLASVLHLKCVQAFLPSIHYMFLRFTTVYLRASAREQYNEKAYYILPARVRRRSHTRICQIAGRPAHFIGPRWTHFIEITSQRNHIQFVMYGISLDLK